jgi:hypothetical protein
MPRASILIVFSESEFLSLMNSNHKLAIESAQAVPVSDPWLRASFVFPCRLDIDSRIIEALEHLFSQLPAPVSP